MEVIKKKEIHIKHLKNILAREKKKESMSVFLVNGEIKKQTARLRVLVDNYNAKAKAAKEEQKQIEQYKKNQARNMEIQMLRQIESEYLKAAPYPPPVGRGGPTHVVK